MGTFFGKNGKTLWHLFAAAYAIGTMCALAQLWQGELQSTSVAMLLFFAGAGAYCGMIWSSVSKALLLFFFVLLLLLVVLTVFSTFSLQVYVSCVMLACTPGMFRGLFSFALFISDGRNAR